MTRSEIWAVQYERVAAYFGDQPQAVIMPQGIRLSGCDITIRALSSRTLGSLVIPQTEIIIDGPEATCEQIYAGFFSRFISAGG